MNETINSGEQMSKSGLSLQEQILKIADRMLRTRPEKDVYYMPFSKMDGVRFDGPLGYLHIDLKALYPHATCGQRVAVDFYISTLADTEIFLNIKAEEAEVLFQGFPVVKINNGKSDHSLSHIDGSWNIPLEVEAGQENRIRIICTKTKNTFGFAINASAKRYPGMWANDYLISLRVLSTHPQRFGEEGIAVSKLFQPGEKVPDNLTYSFPAITDKETFDFCEWKCSGNFAYIYTVAACDTGLEFTGTADAVFVNGYPAEENYVKAGDKILIRCRKEDGGWNFSLCGNKFYLPFLRTKRKHGIHAVWIGGFAEPDTELETHVDFSKIKMDADGEKCYWRFANGDELRVYLDSVFWGQWFYALMVGFEGVRELGENLGMPEYTAFFIRNMEFMACYYDYIQFDAQKHNMPAFMPRSVGIDCLDNCGTLGLELAHSYQLSKNSEVKKCLEKIAEIFEKKLPRFPEGTYFRKETMWADDLYMCAPFLIYYACLTGEKKWQQECVRQVLGFRDRLYMEDECLFSHIYFTTENCPNRVAWGRGNGWVFWALADVLLYLPKNDPEYNEILNLFRAGAARLREIQDETGLWRQVLNRKEKESYLETSATAMFLLVLVRGVSNGWLDASYLSCIKKAWSGLTEYCIDREGNVYGVCMGSGCHMEAAYYYDIPTILNDDHGTGVILAAACEMYKLLTE